MLLAGLAALAHGEEAAPAATKAPEKKLDKITIEGRRLSDTDERRYSTAAKMVFGREELDRYGDSTVGEVLKRLPGVTVSGTPGRGGDIRMRGLGQGYTMILINGEPAPRGFSLDSLAPDQVERIEVMRAPVAEHSTRAIAGTINIVLREDALKRANEARAILGWEAGRLQPAVGMQRSDSIGAFSYNIAANYNHRDLPSESTVTTVATDTVTDTPTLHQSEHDLSRGVSDGVHLTGRLNWRLEGGDNLSLQPFVVHWHSGTSTEATLDQTLGPVPPRFATAASTASSDSTIARLMGNWRTRLGDGGRLELRFNGGLADSDSLTRRRDFDAAGVLVHAGSSDDSIRDSNFSTAGKYSRPLAQAHQIAAGWELEAGNRDERERIDQDGIDPLAAFGGDIGAHTRRLALYAQDEWDVSPLWAIYGGLRWETIATRSRSPLAGVDNRSSVVSPLFHSVWRFTAESKDQIRLALTRSYRAPTLTNLVALPSLSSSYPVSGTNMATSPDSVGNPQLKPELAWGLDAAYEHYLPAGGLLSASLFRRSISDLIRNQTALQNVPWSPVRRWVATPQNVGKAVSYGIELEAKLRLDELIKDAPHIDGRANYSRFWSRVDDVPGPDNRLDQQPRQTANVGADYRLSALPLTLGGNINWTPAFAVRQADAQWYYQGVKRVVDVYALWRFDRNTQLRLSMANLLRADYSTASREVFAGSDQIADTVKKTFRSLALRLEVKF